ncbi:hypothetical protein AAMO2058_001475100 [Amorphochlora amoebiformis]
MNRLAARLLSWGKTGHIRAPWSIKTSGIRTICSFRGVLRHGSREKQPASSPEEVVRFSVVDRDGVTHQVQGKIGDNLLYLFHHFQESSDKLYLEGACEASLACSTCHVILDDNTYDKLEMPEEQEDDMLDQAACLTSTSRLGCQIILSKDLEGMVVKLPPYSKNFYVDGHIPQPH